MIRREISRFFRRQWMFALCGVAILALGFGASTLAHTFPSTCSALVYPGIRPANSATVAEETVGCGASRIAFNRFDSIRRVSSHPARFAAYSRALPADPGGLATVAVSSGFFSVFTEALATGKDFSPGEEGQSGSHVAIISVPLAEQRFGSPSNAVGQRIVLKGRPFEVIGVAPRLLEGMFGETTEVWVPQAPSYRLLWKVQSESKAATSGRP